MILTTLPSRISLTKWAKQIPPVWSPGSSHRSSGLLMLLLSSPRNTKNAGHTVGPQGRTRGPLNQHSAIHAQHGKENHLHSLRILILSENSKVRIHTTPVCSRTRHYPGGVFTTTRYQCKRLYPSPLATATCPYYTALAKRLM